MKKDSASERIMYALAGKDINAPHPLSKVKCPACGVYVEHRHFVPQFGTCEVCYWEYDAHMRSERSREWDMANS